MNELTITFDKDFFLENGEKAIGIFVNQGQNEPLLYKFLVGRNGMWKVIRNFDKKNYTLWDEKREGNYIIMIQAKKGDSEKPFDYVVRSEYIIEKNQAKEGFEKVNKSSKVKKNLNTKESLNVKENLNIKENIINTEEKDFIKKNNSYSEDIHEDIHEDNHDEINIHDHISEDEKKEICTEEEMHKDTEAFRESAIELEEVKEIEGDTKNLEEENKKDEEDIETSKENNKEDEETIENVKEEVNKCRKDEKDFKEESSESESIIKYILVDPKDKYAINEDIVFTVLTENPKNILTKYKLYIDEVLIEEIGYKEACEFVFLPRCIGTYRFEFYVKKNESTKKFDEVMEYTLNVDYSKPIERIDLECDKEFIRCNEDVTFTANSLGGKNVLYEFYILQDGIWKTVQRYGRKNFYTMMPFKKGYYKILVLAKSFHKNIEYENYAIYKFYVNQGKEFTVKTYTFI